MMRACDIFGRIYRDLAIDGRFVSPRGQLAIELEDYSYCLPPLVRFQNFKSRRLNIQYIKDEMLWYLKGDRFDTSIAQKAKIWQSIINDDGSINSNYGQYVFGAMNQFDAVVQTLASDRDSRRASIVILASDHLLSDTKDVPCTYSLNFRIRHAWVDGPMVLNMSVRMRSQDAIFGMGNDAPAFSLIQEMVLNALRRTYPTLQCGRYHHTADSFHVYERHFPMLEKLAGYDIRTKGQIAGWSPDPYEPIDCPPISGPDEVDFLRRLSFSTIPEGFAFTRWLVGADEDVNSSVVRPNR